MNLNNLIIDSINSFSVKYPDKYNPKSIPVGTFAYYVNKSNPFCAKVDFARVHDHYSDGIVLSLVETPDTRCINGIPIQEFETPTKWMKLPKNWNSGLLYEVTTNEALHQKLHQRSYNIKDPVDLLRAYRDGVLVNKECIDHGELQTEVDKNKGFRIVRKYDKYVPSHITLNHHEVYATFEEAQTAMDAYHAELDRIANLSDYDWSVEQIDRTIDHWAYVYNIDDETKCKFRESILEHDDVENIEVRAAHGGILQWKYWKNKKWLNVVV